MVPKRLVKKSFRLAMQCGVSNLAVPIELSSANIPLTSNKKVIAKRKRKRPLVSAAAMTIYKSQGGIFNEIVYEYKKGHPQELVYICILRSLV